MKQIDFENGKITDNILKAALPMLVAQILSLLYNIVDRIYIARIPDMKKFLSEIADETVDLKSLGIRGTDKQKIIDMLYLCYNLNDNT